MKKATDAVDMFNKSAEIYQKKYMDVGAYSKFLFEFNGFNIIEPSLVLSPPPLN